MSADHSRADAIRNCATSEKGQQLKFCPCVRGLCLDDSASFIGREVGTARLKSYEDETGPKIRMSIGTRHGIRFG